jgi:hypothetical protein
MPTTPIGSRVISTSTPGRTEASFSPERRSASPAKKAKIADAFGQRLAFLARQQAAELVLAGEDLVRDLPQHVMALLRGRACPAMAGRLRRGDGRRDIRRGGARVLAHDVVRVGGIDVARHLRALDPFASDEVRLLLRHLVASRCVWMGARRQIDGVR